MFYKDVGIVRTREQLESALKEILEIKEKLPLMGVKDTSKVYNTNLVEFIEFRNVLAVCEQVVSSALKREVSCGAHYIV